jgi:hypothetical protein
LSGAFAEELAEKTRFFSRFLQILFDRVELEAALRDTTEEEQEEESTMASISVL